MAKPNYGFAKRQRELAKKQKKEEKRLRKAAGNEDSAGDDALQTEEGTQLSPTAVPPVEPPQQ